MAGIKITVFDYCCNYFSEFVGNCCAEAAGHGNCSSDAVAPGIVHHVMRLTHQLPLGQCVQSEQD